MSRGKSRHFHGRQLAHEHRLLEKIALGEAAPSVLGALCDSAEKMMGDSVRCAIHLPDSACVRFVQVIAPAFDDYFQRQGPRDIGLAAGTSAAAAYLRRQIVEDQIDTYPPDHPSSNPGGPCYLAREYGIRAVCATPVLSSSAGLLGVFTVYDTRPGAPREEALRIIKWATRIACIALGRERTVSELARSEEKYRSLLDNLRDGVLITQEGMIVYANPVVAELTGRGGQALLGGDFHALIDPADASRLRRLEALRDCGERPPHEWSVRLRRADGDLRILRISQSALIWNGAPASLLALSDITERERAEQEVLRLNAELEQRVEARTRELAAVNRELEAFSYSVSHDLRGPVRAINGFCSILINQHGAAMASAAQAHLERVRQSGRRMDEMIEGLLALARIARKAPRLEQIELSTIAREVFERLREAQPGRAVEIELHDNVTAFGDRRLLHTVLDNLLGNAWKFTSKTAQARIAFGVEVRGGERVYSVRDNGAGFDMKYAGKLFGLFQRQHRSDEFEGTGIGLATVQRIVACHGGRIWAEAEAGRGATFYFTLADPPAAKDTGGAAAGPGPALGLPPPEFPPADVRLRQ